jgi:hypothetical protein
VSATQRRINRLKSRERILDLLLDGEALNTRTVHMHVRTDPTSVRIALDRLVAEDRIAVDADGVIRLVTS